jgi:2-polyprenyl-3-methyl-5-hydroxy-6-metoxy-1,4-benzoquinol methylase
MSLIKTIDSSCPLCGPKPFDLVCTIRDYEYSTCDNYFDIVKCKDCGHHFLNPQPDPSELGTIYPKNYIQYNVEEDGKLAYKIKELLDAREVKSITNHINEDGAVLDIGCAQGGFLDLARRANKNISRFVGIEISEKAAKAAKSKGFEVFIGRLEDFPIETPKFDLIVMQEVLEHVYEPQICIEKVSHLLKDGGRLYITTPSTDGIEFTLFGKRKYWGNYHCPRHFNLFNTRSMSELLSRHNLKIETLTHKIQPAAWIVTFENFLKDKQYPTILYKFFYRENPILLSFFLLIDLISLTFSGKTQDMKIVAIKKPSFD